MSAVENAAKLKKLSELLVDCSDYDDDFWTFAVENEDYVRIALYAKNVTDGYAISTEKLLAECDKASEVLQKFLDDADGEDE